MVRPPLSPHEHARGERLGLLLRAARGPRSMAEIAAVSGVPAETLRKIETGRIATPAFFTVAALAAVLGLALDEIARACAEPAEELTARAGRPARGGLPGTLVTARSALRPWAGPVRPDHPDRATRAGEGMTETTITPTTPMLTDQAQYLIATAARAPSVHNTQPWRFRVGETAIELYCDPKRKLAADPAGREMFISCGAALFGLRLAVRSLGYQPVVDLLPDPGRLRLLARVSLGAAMPMTAAERETFRALPHRHTHRGAFGSGPLPAGLVAGLQHDALAEGAMLAIVEPGLAYGRLSDIAHAVGRRLQRDARSRSDARRWTRSPASLAQDGIPAYAFPATSRAALAPPPGRLPERDFDLGRGLGLADPEGPPPAVTAALVTPGDSRADWLRAGQGLHRLLLHAASRWVFASLHTELLEITTIRALIRDRLALPGAPQMLLQLGVVDTTHPTGRRPPDELIEP